MVKSSSLKRQFCFIEISLCAILHLLGLEHQRARLSAFYHKHAELPSVCREAFSQKRRKEQSETLRTEDDDDSGLFPSVVHVTRAVPRRKLLQLLLLTMTTEKLRT